MHKERKIGKWLYNVRLTEYLDSGLLYALWMQGHDSDAWSRGKAKASLLQHKHLKLSLFSHHKQRHPVPTQDQKHALLLPLPLVYTPIRPHTQLCDHGDMQNVTFSFESWWGVGVPVYQITRTYRRQTFPYNCADECSSTKSKRLPDKTVNMAAKALSLSPSITFPKWQTSIDMRIPPVARSRMYRHSATIHSHKTPGGERERER